MDDCLACPVCFESYNSASNTPLILTCGHTVCTKCINSIYNTTQLICPLDRVLDTRKPEQLPKNIALIHVIDHQSVKNPSHPCQSHPQKKVKFFCINPCKALFCSDCIGFHQFHTFSDFKSLEKNENFKQNVDFSVNLAREM